MSGLTCLKKSQTEDEDAQELKLGPDFSEAQCLSVSEVRLVMEAMIYDYSGCNGTSFCRSECAHSNELRA